MKSDNKRFLFLRGTVARNSLTRAVIRMRGCKSAIENENSHGTNKLTWIYYRICMFPFAS